MIKGFTGEKWYNQTNPAFRKSCFKKAVEETLELKKQYDFFIKCTNK